MGDISGKFGPGRIHTLTRQKMSRMSPVNNLMEYTPCQNRDFQRWQHPYIVKIFLRMSHENNRMKSTPCQDIPLDVT